MKRDMRFRPAFERFEDLLETGGAPQAELDRLEIPIIGRSLRRARFSYGSLLGVDVRQTIESNDDQRVIVSLTTGSMWMGVYLEHEDGFVACHSGGMFAVSPRSAFLNEFGMSQDVRQHGPLTIDCQIGLIELSLGSSMRPLFPAE